ncbi:ESPR-type extended signal peptide-containing protein, partial [Basilea psittacipulmonis]
MNKIFKVIFNRNKNRCEVASEFAKGHVKSSAGQSLEQAGVLRYFPLSVLAVLVGLIGTPAWATVEIKDGQIISTSGTNVSNVTIADIYKGLQLGGGKSQVSYEGTGWVLPLGFNQTIHGGVLNTSNSTDSAANLANYTNNKAANANSVGTIAIGGGYTGATASGRGSVVVGDGASATGNVYSIGVTYYHDAYGNTLAYNPDNPLVAAIKSKSLGAYWSGAAAAFGNKAKADGGVALAVGTGSTAEGNFATALGGASKALRDNTVAVGYATATATNSIAQGASAFAGSKEGIAIGSKTRAGNSEEIAKLEKEYTDLQMYFNNGLQYNGKTVTQEQVGAAKKKLYEAYNESNVASAMAIGDGAQAWSYAGMALGRLADSRGSDAIAIGNSVKSYGERSIAIGAVAHAYNNSSVSLGDSARSVAEQAYAVGRNSKAGAKDVIVFGSGASAGWNDNLETLSQAVNTANDARNAAINEQNAANTALKQAYTDNNATAISAARDRVTKADADYETKNKARQDAITALKEAGKSNSAVDAIAIGNNANASGKSALALMRFATANATDAIVIGNSAEGSAERALALGYVAKASGKDAIAIGGSAKATNTNATAIGPVANASGVDSVAFGYSSKAIGESSLALGRVSIANATDAIAIGNSGYASGNNSIAIGRSAAVGYTSNTYNTKNGSNYTQDKVVNNSIALGYYARTEMDNSVALGTFSRVTEGEDTVTESQKSYLTNKDQSTKGIVSVGAGSSNYGSINDVSMTNALTRRITNVADGVLDDDAVTVAQLKKLQITGGGSETTVATTADITASDTSTDGVNHNYQLTLNKGKVAENETKVVSGGDVYSAINKAKPTVESKDNSVTVTKTAATATEGEKYDLSVKKDGQVVSGNTDVVTGGTVYSA